MLAIKHSRKLRNRFLSQSRVIKCTSKDLIIQIFAIAAFHAETSLTLNLTTFFRKFQTTSNQTQTTRSFINFYFVSFKVTAIYFCQRFVHVSRYSKNSVSMTTFNSLCEYSFLSPKSIEMVLVVSTIEMIKAIVLIGSIRDRITKYVYYLFKKFQDKSDETQTIRSFVNLYSSAFRIYNTVACD